MKENGNELSSYTTALQNVLYNTINLLLTLSYFT